MAASSQPQEELSKEALQERMRCAQSGDSYTRAAFRAEVGPLEVDFAETAMVSGAIPTVASELLLPAPPVGWPRKVPDGKGRLVSKAKAKPLLSRQAVSDVDGFRIQTHPSDSGSPTGSRHESRPCDILCEERADEAHLAARRSLQARRAVVGGPVNVEEEEEVCCEPDILNFIIRWTSATRHNSGPTSCACFASTPSSSQTVRRAFIQSMGSSSRLSSRKRSRTRTSVCQWSGAETRNSVAVPAFFPRWSIGARRDRLQDVQRTQRSECGCSTRPCFTRCCQAFDPLQQRQRSGAQRLHFW